MLWKFENEIVYNKVYLNQPLPELLDPSELALGLTISIVALFSIWIVFHRLKSSIFNYENVQDYFEGR